MERMGFPKGRVYLGETQAERLALVRNLRKKFDFIADIGDSVAFARQLRRQAEHREGSGDDPA